MMKSTRIERAMLRWRAPLLGFAFLYLDLACSGDDSTPSAATGGNPTSSSGGSSGGMKATGGVATGGAVTGGTSSGGTPAVSTGGVPASGGSPSVGGAGAGGAPSTAGNAGGAGKALGGAGGAPAVGGSAGRAGGGSGGKASGGGAGSGGAVGGGGSGGGSSDFNPCPAKGEPCKIMPLGDSITDGFGTAGGYRIELFSKALADGKSITFVGRFMNGPTMVAGQTFPRSHEGTSGITIGGLDMTIPEPALNPDPHIVLLHIGTNDMRNANGAPDRLATLMDQILTTLPDSLLVVSSIVPLPSSANAVSTYNAAIPPLVQTRASAGKHVIYLDQFKGFPDSELADGVHPSPAGYARMAGVWYEGIKDLLR
jgi:lysophospholipase L1-like esterase